MTTVRIDPTFNTGATRNPNAASNSQSAVSAAIAAFNSNSEFEQLRYSLSNSVLSSSKNIYVTTEKLQASNVGFDDRSKYVPGHYTVTGGFTGSGDVGPTKPDINYINSAPSAAAENGAGFVYLGPDIMNASAHTLTYADAAGGTFQGSLLRTLVHELGHAATNAYGHEETWRSTAADNLNFNEEIAAFIENAYYVPYAQRVGLEDQNLRLGHDTYGLFQTEGGVTGTTYFEGMSTPYIRLTENGDVEFSALSFNDDGSYTQIAKTYHHVGHEVLGQQYDRYITVVATFSAGVFSSDLTDVIITKSLFTDTIRLETAMDPITLRIEDARQSINAMVHAADGFMEDLSSDDMTRMLLSDMGYYDISVMSRLDQTRTLTLGTDRFFQDGYDTSGPTAIGFQSAPDVITIDDRLLFDNNPDYGTQYEGTVIVGASGYHEELVDLSDSTDVIHAGDGNDLLFAGNGRGFGDLNYLFGNMGNDILIGGEGNDLLNGGEGADLLIGGTAGDDLLYGGDGFDVASYASSSFTNGIYYHGNVSSVTAIGFGKSDTLAQIEAVVGSPNDDVFYSGSNHVMMIGNAGDDVFYLQNRDVVVGGEGDDRFHISVKTGSHPAEQKILILGFEAGDELWIDGQRFYGSLSTTKGIQGDSIHGYADATVTFNSNGSPDPFATGYQISSASSRTDYWTNTLSYGDSNDTKGGDLLSLITIEHIVNGQSASKTEIFLSGFTPGDGGIQYSMSDAIVSSNGHTADPGFNFYRDVTATDISYDHYLPYGYPTISDYFQNIEPII